MAELSRLLTAARGDAGASCSECLHKFLVSEALDLQDRLAELTEAAGARNSAPDSGARYDKAHREVMTSLVVIGALAMELAARPVLAVSPVSSN